MCILTEDTRRMVEEQYDADDRHYHGMKHIDDYFYYLNRYKRLLTSDELTETETTAIKYMIWFHDVIYSTDPRLKHGLNESKSAWIFTLSPEFKTASLEIRELVVAGINATAHHASNDMMADKPFAVRLFQDIDLSGLASSYPEFLKAGAAIRREYASVSDADFLAGRKRFFTDLMSREFIFKTQLVRGLNESYARTNIQRWLDEVSN